MYAQITSSCRHESGATWSCALKEVVQKLDRELVAGIGLTREKYSCDTCQSLTCRYVPSRIDQQGRLEQFLTLFVQSIALLWLNEHLCSYSEGLSLCDRHNWQLFDARL